MSSIVQLTREALALPIDERIRLAQMLWESVQSPSMGEPADDEAKALELAVRRDDELARGVAQGLSHADAMSLARASIPCK